jgi:hypothetical protein
VEVGVSVGVNVSEGVGVCVGALWMGASCVTISPRQ